MFACFVAICCLVVIYFSLYQKQITDMYSYIIERPTIGNDRRTNGQTSGHAHTHTRSMSEIDS